MTKVVIADDHAVVRAGLRALLQDTPQLELIAEASGGVEALELVKKLQPEILVLDLSMPDMDGISVTRQLKELHLITRVLILTVHEDEALLKEAIQAGASGYILKQAAESELVSAIQVILRGDLYVDPSLLRSLLNEQVKIATCPQGDRRTAHSSRGGRTKIDRGGTHQPADRGTALHQRAYRGGAPGQPF